MGPWEEATIHRDAACESQSTGGDAPPQSNAAHIKNLTIGDNAVKAEDEYLEAQVMTATPHQLHLMVVDGALRFSRQAEAALKEKDFETSHFSLNRARECVNEIIGGLREDRQEDLVEQLRALFGFVYQNLARADLEQSPDMVADAIRILELHRETWVQLGETLRVENAASPAAQPKTPGLDLTSDARLDVPTGRSWTG